MHTINTISKNMKELKFEKDTADLLRISTSNGSSSICVINFNQEIYCFEYDKNYNIPEYKIERLDILKVLLDNVTKYLIFNTCDNITSLTPEQFNRIRKKFFKVFYATI